MMRLLVVSAVMIITLTITGCGDDDTTLEPGANTTASDQTPADSGAVSLASYFAGLESAYAEFYEALDVTGDGAEVPRDDELDYLIDAFSNLRRDLIELNGPPLEVLGADQRLSVAIGNMVGALRAERDGGDEPGEPSATARGDEVTAACQALLAIGQANGIDAAIECADDE